MIILNTILMRPYVFIFLAVFLTAGFWNMGKKRTLWFLAVTWIITFICEYSSTRNGFPFGLYHYTGDTKGKELFISNVPFFDSLSFTFLLYSAYSMALFMVSPLKVEKKNFTVAHTFEIRQSKSVLFLTTMFMMMIDVVIDPVALRGDQWFLGRIYYYEYSGFYFGVPLSNAVGWAFVGFVSFWVYQKVEKKYLSGPDAKPVKCKVPYHSLMGVGLYYGVLLFMLSICWWINEKALLIASTFLYLIPTALLIVRFNQASARATDQEWKKHCEDFSIT